MATFPHFATDTGLGNTAGMLKRAATIGLLALLAGCDGSPLPEAVTGPGDLRSMPWPSDVLLGSDGHLVVAPPFPFPAEDASATLLAQALSALDGFGTVTAVFFPVSTDVTVDAGAAAAVVDLEGSEPPRAFPLLYRAATRQLVAVAPPGTVLREHHRYGCVVSGGVHDSAGRRAAPVAGDGRLSWPAARPRRWPIGCWRPSWARPAQQAQLQRRRRRSPPRPCPPG